MRTYSPQPLTGNAKAIVSRGIEMGEANGMLRATDIVGVHVEHQAICVTRDRVDLECNCDPQVHLAPFVIWRNPSRRIH